jgi:hypothetical protein
MQTKSKSHMPRSAGETTPYTCAAAPARCIPIAHCIALRSNADESKGFYGAFDKFISLRAAVLAF